MARVSASDWPAGDRTYDRVGRLRHKRREAVRRDRRQFRADSAGPSISTGGDTATTTLNRWAFGASRKTTFPSREPGTSKQKTWRFVMANGGTITITRANAKDAAQDWEDENKKPVWLLLFIVVRFHDRLYTPNMGEGKETGT